MILKCERIKKYFKGRSGLVKAVDGVSFEIGRGECFGLVGESGSGKTTLGKIILGIVKEDAGRVILNTKEKQVVFQDPYNSLDPKMRVYDILAEGLIIRRASSPSGRLRFAAHCVVRRADEIKRRIEEVLELVKLPKEALEKYPHQFSGGERQRIAIARAVLTNPEFIVCDEPVSSLDVTIQLQVLNLLKAVQGRYNIAYLFISHDLKVIRYMCGSMAVMRYGRIVEQGEAARIYSKPEHPYTRALLSSAFYDIIENDEK